MHRMKRDGRKTGVLITLDGVTISWKSSRQVQAPRSTAESEVTAMAYAGQTLEGVNSLYETMGIQLKRPTLWCDNRAAVCLTTGSNDWRTKSLVNKVLGLWSLVELGVLVISYKSTLEMAADVLTKFMKKGVIQRCRQLIGCVDLPGVQTP